MITHHRKAVQEFVDDAKERRLLDGIALDDSEASDSLEIPVLDTPFAVGAGAANGAQHADETGDKPN